MPKIERNPRRLKRFGVLVTIFVAAVAIGILIRRQARVRIPASLEGTVAIQQRLPTEDCADRSDSKPIDQGFLELGKLHVARLRSAKESHVYRLQLSKGSQLEVEVADSGPNHQRFCPKLLTPAGEKIKDFEKGSWSAESTGEYRIEVWAAQDGGGEYRLLARDLLLEEGTRLSFGKHQFGTIGQERDVYSFAALEGRRLSLLVHDVNASGPGSIKPKVTLTEVGGREPRQIWIGEDPETFARNWVTDASGEYKVLVQEASGLPGQYMVCLDETSITSISQVVHTRGSNARVSWTGPSFALPAFMVPAAGRESSSQPVLVVTSTGAGESEKVHHIKSGELTTLIPKGSEGVALRGSLLANGRSARFELFRIRDANELIKEVEFTLEAGEAYSSKLRVIRKIVFEGVAKAAAGGTGGGVCCVTCGGARACACAVMSECGECCMPPCCHYSL